MSETIVKNLSFGIDARDKIFSGIDKLTEAVSSTLGAGGQCVIMEDSSGNPVITKDGVTVADTITLLDPVENMGAKLLKQAARKTVREAGDGTTTATVLARAILLEAYKHKDINVRKLKEGINSAVEKVIKSLEKNSVKVKGNKIEQVATISANNDKELGKIISDAFKAVDETGVVMMDTNEEPFTVIEKIDGVQYDQGLINHYFITDKQRGVSELENPVVFISDSPIENIRKIQNILEYVIKENKQLLIIADLDEKVLNALAMNKVKGNIKVNVIPSPPHGINRKQILDDLSLMTGATVVSEKIGDDMSYMNEDILGRCLKSVTSNIDTVLQIDKTPKEVEEIVLDLKEQIKNTTNSNFIINLEKRLSRLSAKVATVKVGAHSEVELKEKKDRVEDAICATKAAIKEGIVPGGGIALLNASVNVKSSSDGEEVLLKAIKAPYETILANAGLDLVYPQTKGIGLNVVTGKEVSMVRAGIIDPLLVTKSALKNAASVATTILSTDCVINNLRA